MIESLTVKQLIAVLKKQPQDWRVFVSSDPEGNGFNSLDKDYMIGGSNEDKVIILYPIAQHLDDEVMPIEMKRISNMSMEELQAEIKSQGEK